jgi:hypothetical protein
MRRPLAGISSSQTSPGTRTAQLLGPLVALGAALAIAYATVVRPWMLTWGSTEEERTRPLPGNDLVPAPTHSTTHAITIHAPPYKIWPWLVQMGQDRAGFYTHNWVEKLLLSGIPDVHALHPEWQDLQVGDIMRTTREIRPGHPIGWPVALIEPNRALVVGSRGVPPGTWALVLDPIDGQTTRLLSRDRVKWRRWQSPFRLLAFEPLHAYMQTGVLQGIKQRAELPIETAPVRADAAG